MALLAAQAHLVLDEDRDGGVGEREQEGERRGVVEREVGAERRGEDRGQEREGGPNQVEVQEEDRRQRQQRGREREGERRPGGPARVAGEERLGGGEQPPREPQRRGGDGRRGKRPRQALDRCPPRPAAPAPRPVGGGGRRCQSRQRFVAIWKSQVEKRRPGSKRRAARTTRSHVSW